MCRGPSRDWAPLSSVSRGPSICRAPSLQGPLCVHRAGGPSARVPLFAAPPPLYTPGTYLYTTTSNTSTRSSERSRERRDGNGGSLCLSAHSRGLISANVIHQDPRAAMQVPEGLMPEVKEHNLIRYASIVDGARLAAAQEREADERAAHQGELPRVHLAQLGIIVIGALFLERVECLERARHHGARVPHGGPGRGGVARRSARGLLREQRRGGECGVGFGGRVRSARVGYGAWRACVRVVGSEPEGSLVF